MPKEIAPMLKWIGEHGFKANINELRQEHPGLLTFAAWLGTFHRQTDPMCKTH
jgi:hypothetical protein